MAKLKIACLVCGAKFPIRRPDAPPAGLTQPGGHEAASRPEAGATDAIRPAKGDRRAGAKASTNGVPPTVHHHGAPSAVAELLRQRLCAMEARQESGNAC